MTDKTFYIKPEANVVQVVQSRKGSQPKQVRNYTPTPSSKRRLSHVSYDRDNYTRFYFYDSETVIAISRDGNYYD